MKDFGSLEASKLGPYSYFFHLRHSILKAFAETLGSNVGYLRKPHLPRRTDEVNTMRRGTVVPQRRARVQRRRRGALLQSLDIKSQASSQSSFRRSHGSKPCRALSKPTPHEAKAVEGVG